MREPSHGKIKEGRGEHWGTEQRLGPKEGPIKGVQWGSQGESDQGRRTKTGVLLPGNTRHPEANDHARKKGKNENGPGRQKKKDPNETPIV